MNERILFSSLKDSSVDLENDLFTSFPTHESHESVNSIISQTEHLIGVLYKQSLEEQDNYDSNSEYNDDTEETEDGAEEEVYANSYVDMGKVSMQEE